MVLLFFFLAQFGCRRNVSEMWNAELAVSHAKDQFEDKQTMIAIQRSTTQMCQGLNSYWFPVVRDGHQPIKLELFHPTYRGYTSIYNL